MLQDVQHGSQLTDDTIRGLTSTCPSDQLIRGGETPVSLGQSVISPRTRSAPSPPPSQPRLAGRLHVPLQPRSQGAPTQTDCPDQPVIYARARSVPILHPFQLRLVVRLHVLLQPHNQNPSLKAHQRRLILFISL